MGCGGGALPRPAPRRTFCPSSVWGAYLLLAVRGPTTHRGGLRWSPCEVSVHINVERPSATGRPGRGCSVSACCTPRVFPRVAAPVPQLLFHLKQSTVAVTVMPFIVFVSFDPDRAAESKVCASPGANASAACLPVQQNRGGL